MKVRFRDLSRDEAGLWQCPHCFEWRGTAKDNYYKRHYRGNCIRNQRPILSYLAAQEVADVAADREDILDLENIDEGLAQFGEQLVQLGFDGAGQAQAHRLVQAQVQTQLGRRQHGRQFPRQQQQEEEEEEEQQEEEQQQRQEEEEEEEEEEEQQQRLEEEEEEQQQRLEEEEEEGPGARALSRFIKVVSPHSTRVQAKIVIGDGDTATPLLEKVDLDAASRHPEQAGKLNFVEVNEEDSEDDGGYLLDNKSVLKDLLAKGKAPGVEVKGSIAVARARFVLPKVPPAAPAAAAAAPRKVAEKGAGQGRGKGLLPDDANASLHSMAKRFMHQKADGMMSPKTGGPYWHAMETIIVDQLVRKYGHLPRVTLTTVKKALVA
jgi:chemotaxis protein histidine kinase CheA